MAEYETIGAQSLPDTTAVCDTCGVENEPALWFFPHPGYEIDIRHKGGLGYARTLLRVNKGILGVCTVCLPFVRERNFKGLWAWVLLRNPHWKTRDEGLARTMAYQESVLLKIVGDGEEWKRGTPRPTTT